MHRSLFQHEDSQTYSVTLRFMVSFFPGCLAFVDRHFGYHRPGASTKDPKVLEFFAVSTLILSLSCAKHLCSVSLLDSFHHFNMIFCCSWWKSIILGLSLLFYFSKTSFSLLYLVVFVLTTKMFLPIKTDTNFKAFLIKVILYKS